MRWDRSSGVLDVLEMIIAYVPARGGSKEILRKNLIRVGDESLVERTIRASLDAKLIDSTWVSTDDSEILSLAARSGAESGYRRPSQLAGDESSIVDGLLHFLEWYQVNYRSEPDAIVVLQPTSPFRDGLLIDGAIKRFVDRGVPSLFSVSKVNQHPREMIVWGEYEQDWSRLPGWNQKQGQRQSYEQNLYFINGSIFIVKPAFVRTSHELISPGLSEPFEIPKEFALEIDSSFDLLQARRLEGGVR
jgi:CMP-N,N'-diacetyllegionaminic acid synthase